MTEIKELEHIVRIDNGVFRHALIVPDKFVPDNPSFEDLHWTFTPEHAEAFKAEFGGKTLTVQNGSYIVPGSFGYQLDGNMNTRMWSAVQPYHGQTPSPHYDYRKVPMHDAILNFQGETNRRRDPRFFLFRTVHNAFVARALDELNEEAKQDGVTYLADRLTGDMHHGSITFVKVKHADANRQSISGFGFLSANDEDLTHDEQRSRLERNVEESDRRVVLGEYIAVNGYAAGSPFVILGR